MLICYNKILLAICYKYQQFHERFETITGVSGVFDRTVRCADSIWDEEIPEPENPSVGRWKWWWHQQRCGAFGLDCMILISGRIVSRRGLRVGGVVVYH